MNNLAQEMERLKQRDRNEALEHRTVVQMANELIELRESYADMDERVWDLENDKELAEELLVVIAGIVDRDGLSDKEKIEILKATLEENQ